jgi:amidophosphoribosyltransferase
MLIIDDEVIATGQPKSMMIHDRPSTPRHCVFEFIYFSRPDSQIFGHSVDKVRRKLGKTLASTRPVTPKNDSEKQIVINVPDSSNTATMGFVQKTQEEGRNAKLEIGLIRSHYIGRTFIQPGQDVRENKVKTKFNTVKGVLQDKVVVIVDDSIVRGTTSKQLVQLVKQAGPKEIHFRVSSPPIKYPCHYGMDFPTPGELIANRCGGDVDRIASELQVDSLGYLSIDDLLKSVPHENGEQYCTACFSGEYPVKIDMTHKKDENDA